MQRITQKNTAANVKRIATICKESKPISPSARTKIPILPQKHPAIRMSSIPVFSFFRFFRSIFNNASFVVLISLTPSFPQVNYTGIFFHFTSSPQSSFHHDQLRTKLSIYLNSASAFSLFLWTLYKCLY